MDTLTALIVGVYLCGMLGVADVLVRSQDDPEVREVLDLPPRHRVAALALFIPGWPLLFTGLAVLAAAARITRGRG